MIEMRWRQLSFGDGLIAEEVSDLRDDWMEAADRVLADEEIGTAVCEVLAPRHPRAAASVAKGRPRSWSCACWSSNACATGSYGLGVIADNLVNIG